MQGPRGAGINLARRVSPLIEENLPAVKDAAFRRGIAREVPEAANSLSPFQVLEKQGAFSGPRTTGSFPMPEDNAWKALAEIFLSDAGVRLK